MYLEAYSIVLPFIVLLSMPSADKHNVVTTVYVTVVKSMLSRGALYYLHTRRK